MTDLPNLSGKTALVTGASRGIGRAVALGLAKAGAHVLALARTQGGLEELDDEIRAQSADAGGKASLITFDLTADDNIERLAEALGARFDKLDILFANAAALGELGPLTDVDPKIWNHVLALNLTVNWRLIRALDPLLRNSEDARVLFLSSRVGGEQARAYWGPYGVSKAALEHLAETYALENTQSSISVGVVDPGAMRTAMRASAMPGEDPQTLPAPEEIVPMIYEALDARAGPFRRWVFREWVDSA
jgi:NAD(P)-dependent dehydrogenase (short-subunit alcohol dehydrogenase family)